MTISRETEETRNARSGSVCTDPDDPVLAMVGVGEELWAVEPGDQFVERLRSEEPLPPPAPLVPPVRSQDLHDKVWQRILEHQGEPFRTVTGLPFTYEVEGNGIWFFRDGRRINRKLPRRHVNKAVDRCPLGATTDIADLFDFAYLFALLKDGRIRGNDW